MAERTLCGPLGSLTGLAFGAEGLDVFRERRPVEASRDPLCSLSSAKMTCEDRGVVHGDEVGAEGQRDVDLD